MARMVIEVPEEHKELLAPIEALIAHVVTVTGKHAARGAAVDYAAVERDVGERTAAIERAAHGEILRSLDVDAPKVRIGSVVYSRVERCPGTYYTMAGEVSVERSLYRRDGERNSKVVDAISLRAGVVEDGWLPRVADAMAFEVQRGPAREAAQAAAKVGRLVYSRCSYERVSHAVAAHYDLRHEEIHDALIAAYEPPAKPRRLSVGLDRASMPMAEPRPRPPGRPKEGAAKNPISIEWRMAWVATVTLHDQDGNALHTIRYATTHDEGPDNLLAAALGDVLTLVANDPTLKVTLLSDGAHDIVEHLATKVGRHLVVPVEQLVDFWHTIEKLAAAARLLGDDEALLRRWRFRLLNTTHAVVDILHELRQSGREDVCIGETKPVHEAITYLDNHKQRMNYAAARAAGSPIGSGNTEATCKTIFETRMKRTGARWKIPTGRHVLHLRALATSDRWDDAIDLTLRPLRVAVHPMRAAA